MRIFFSVGEPSGDLHGANLVRELRQRHSAIECVGYGGPRMAAEGCQLLEDLTQLALMGFVRVALYLRRFWKLYRRANDYFRTARPDAVVLIDYPGFNWWIARAAKRNGIPVFYYGVPQMWAWAGWRVKKMRRLVDHVLCKLPFEADWFRERHCRATYVGHPYFDEVAQRQLDEAFVRSQCGDAASPLVTILPGSRTQELLSNLPWFLRTAKLVRQQRPETRFAIAAFNEKQAAIARSMVQQSNEPIDVFVGRTPELIEAAHSCLACSGSVSLELLSHEKPTVILYFINRLQYWGQDLLKTARFITLVNLLATKQRWRRRGEAYDPDAPGAEQVPFPEYLTFEDKSPAMASRLITWLSEPVEHAACKAWLRQLKGQFAIPGASRTAAEYILTALGLESTTAKSSIPRPHFPIRGAA